MQDKREKGAMAAASDVNAAIGTAAMIDLTRGRSAPAAGAASGAVPENISNSTRSIG
jgi:hypothetical protein